MTAITISAKLPALTDSPVLQGDIWISWHRLSLAVLSEGTSSLDNVPHSPFFNGLIDLYRQLGVKIEQEENRLIAQGRLSRLPGLEEPLTPGHEIPLMTLGALFAGFKSANTLTLDHKLIPRETTDLFQKIFECRILDNPAKGPMVVRPSAFRPQAADKYKNNHLVKIARVYFQLIHGDSGEIDVTDSGPDHLEKSVCFFGKRHTYKATDLEETDELTKRMLKKLGRLEKPSQTLMLYEGEPLAGQTTAIPGDVTETAVYLLAATLTRGSNLTLENTCVNPSRIAFINALKRMGGDINISKKKERNGEVVGTVTARFSELTGRKFDFKNLGGMREEIPLLIAAGCLAQGKTIIRNVSFLRTFELDVLRTMIADLKAAHVEIGEIEDGLIINGKDVPQGVVYDTRGQGMLGWAYWILASHSEGDSTVKNSECLHALYPALWKALGC